MALSCFCPHCGAEAVSSAQHCHACQQPLAGEDTTTPAAVLLHERYEILSELGSGGFGAVYRARDTQDNGRLVAIKSINLKGLAPQEAIEATDAFNREAELLTALDHAHLPRVFDRFHDAEHWYLALTFIEGQTLDEYLCECAVKSLPKRVGLPLNETLEVGLQLCDVLHYLHTREPAVIFRDLKPGNIMRTPGGELFLIDFGIARRFKPGQARDTIPFGSPGFASPEQYGRAQTTPQADIYSLGALLYYLLSDDDPSEHPLQFPELRIPEVTGLHETERLIQRMVALEPSQRPATVREVQQELQAIKRLAAQTTQQKAIWLPPAGQTPPPPGSAQPIVFPSAPKWQTTRRNLISGGIAAGIFLALGGAVIGMRQLARSNANAVSPAAMTAIAQDAEATYTTQYATDTTQTQATDTAQIAQHAAIPLDGPTFWSPDLSHAAVLNTNRQQIDVYQVRGKRLLGSIKPDGSFGSSDFAGSFVQWSPDNQKLVVIPSYNSGPNAVWDIPGGRQLYHLFPNPLAVQATIWSPDGAYLAIEYTNDDNTPTNLTLVRANDGANICTFKAANQLASNSVPAWSPDSAYVLLPDMNFAEVSANGTWSATIWQSSTAQPINKLTISVPWSIGQTLIGDTSLYISWSPQGDTIAVYYAQYIWICSLTSVKTSYRVTANAGAELDYGPTWSPNGQYLSMVLDGNLVIVHALSGKPLFWTWSGNTSSPPTNLVAFAWSTDSKHITVVDNDNMLTQCSL